MRHKEQGSRLSHGLCVRACLEHVGDPCLRRSVRHSLKSCASPAVVLNLAWTGTTSERQQMLLVRSNI